MRKTTHRSFRLTPDPQMPAKLARLKRLIFSGWFLRRVVAAMTVCLIHFFVSGVAHSYFAAHLYLCRIYGFVTVREQSLTLTHMPRGKDWTVSNGDVIPNGGHEHLLYGLILWLPLMVIASGLLVRLLRLAEPPPSSQIRVESQTARSIGTNNS